MNKKEFRDGVMPRGQLSMRASQLAVDKTTQKNAKEFAGFELMEAKTVIEVLKDVGTSVSPLNEDGKAFIEKLKSASGNEFDKLYMHAELTNHEFLRDLAQRYLETGRKLLPPKRKHNTQQHSHYLRLKSTLPCAKEFTE